MWFIKPTKGSPSLKSAREYSNKMFEKSEICSLCNCMDGWYEYNIKKKNCWTFVKSTTWNWAISEMLLSGELWTMTWPSKPLTTALADCRRIAVSPSWSGCTYHTSESWVSISLVISSIYSQVWTISIWPDPCLFFNKLGGISHFQRFMLLYFLL
jgi:hypothetical protein